MALKLSFHIHYIEREHIHVLHVILQVYPSLNSGRLAGLVLHLKPQAALP